MDIGNFIEQIVQQRKEQDAIYHSAAVKYNLSDTAMWVLYIVSGSTEICTQQELCRMCFCAKQTIHTAIRSLIKSGCVELEAIPGTRNQKKIVLTEKGQVLARNTTDNLRAAEFRAYGRLSDEELEAYLNMTSRLTSFLREEIEKLL